MKFNSYLSITGSARQLLYDLYASVTFHHIFSLNSINMVHDHDNDNHSMYVMIFQYTCITHD